MPLTTVEVFVVFYFRGMDLPYPAIQDILRLKLQPHFTLLSKLSQKVADICAKERRHGYPPMRRSTGEWDRPVLDDFLKRTASDLSEEAKAYLTHIGDAEQEIIDRHTGKPKSSKRPRPREDDASQNEAVHGQSPESSPLPPAHTTGFTPVNQDRRYERTRATDRHSRKRSREEPSPPRSRHDRISESSTATNFPSPYGPTANNGSRHVDNQPAYNPGTFGGDRTNAGSPFQSPNYPYDSPPLQNPEYPYGAAPPYTPDYPHGGQTPYSDYSPEQSDRAAKRRSTGPPARSAYPSTAPSPKGPRDPGGRDDIYF